MLRFFDCNAGIGKPKAPPPGGVLDTARLLEEMDRYGIEESLVYHLLSKRHDPMRGNLLAAESARVSPRLRPCWFVLPTGTGEMPPLDELGARMEADGVRCVRIAPDAATHQFSVSRMVCGELFEWLNARRVPLMTEYSGITWRDADFVLESYPGLPFILLDVTYRVNRDVYPRVASGANLYIETSGFQQHCGIQDFCDRFGPDRLLFGSRLPYFCPGPAKYLVESAPVGEEAKTRIVGDNLRRLLADADPALRNRGRG